MSNAQATSVKEWWHSARHGNLSPWSLAQVYALHKVRFDLLCKSPKATRRYVNRASSETASRQKVEAMYRAIRDGRVTAAHRKEADDAFDDFTRTFSRTDGGGALGDAKEWKFRAAQLTYNGTAGDWASKDMAVLKALFDRLVGFFQDLSAAWRIVGLSVTLEESLESGEHVHAHVYLHMDREFRRRGPLTEFVFDGIKPHVETNRAPGKSYSGAVRHGHFYVFVEKRGSLFKWANFQPFKHYAVEAWWLDNLLKHGKLDRDTYLAYASRVGIGFKRRLEDVVAAERYERERAVLAHVESEARLARTLLKPVKSYPEVDTFIDNFKVDKLRRPILAIIGGTNLGKSMLARNVLERVSAILGLAGFVEITVEMNEHLDMSDFDVRSHGGVLLDGVGDAFILKKNREALQGRAKVAKGAQSATMMYSYKYTLSRRAVVATFDLSAANLDALHTDHWLKNPLNVIQLRLTESVINDDPSSSGGLTGA